MEGLAVGGISVEFNDNKDIYCSTVEIGYWLGEKYWNRGIISEAIKLIIYSLFISILSSYTTCGSKSICNKYRFTESISEIRIISIRRN